MKKLLLITLALIPSLGRAQHTGYHLTITLRALKAPAKAYLVTSFGWTNQQVIDSTGLNKGKFLFSGTVEEPTRAQLVIDHTGQGLKSLGEKAVKADVRTVYLEPGNILVPGRKSQCG